MCDIKGKLQCEVSKYCWKKREEKFRNLDILSEA